MKHWKKGYVHIYTGNGKGKTTSMLGLSLRAAGAGLKVYIGQFIKNGEYSEIKAIRQYLPQITVEQYGCGFIGERNAEKDDINSAESGLRKVRDIINSGEYDVVMLDEINVAVHLGLVNLSDVIDIVKQKPESVELVMTGRYAKDELIELADVVSEIKEVKHYYKKGVNARVGIEK